MLLPDACEALAQDASCLGLWQIDHMTSEENDVETIEPMDTIRLVYLQQDKLIEIFNVETDHVSSLTRKILAFDRKDGRNYCLIKYPENFPNERGRMIVCSNRTNAALLDITFEGYGDYGKIIRNTYNLTRPKAMEAIRYQKSLSDAGILPISSPKIDVKPATNHVLHESRRASPAYEIIFSGDEVILAVRHARQMQ